MEVMKAFRTLIVFFVAIWAPPADASEKNDRPPTFSSPKVAQAHCPKDAVVWLDITTGTYYPKSYSGGRPGGVFVCKREAEATGHHDEQGDIDKLLKQITDAFCAAYEAPVGDETCKPAWAITDAAQHIVNIETLVDCGPEIESAFRNAIKKMKFAPASPPSLRGRILTIILSGQPNEHSVTPSCEFWKKLDKSPER